MKIVFQLILVAGLGSVLSGCMSTRGYLVDRCRDTCDMVTLAVEEKGVNASARVGALTVGIGCEIGHGFGLRSGAIGKYKHGELQTVLMGGINLEPSEFDKSRGKGYDLACSTLLPLSPVSEGFKEGRWHNAFQVEMTACVGVGVRVGANLAEALDFVLGWFGLDICGDDVGIAAKSEASEVVSEHVTEGNRD